MIYPSPLGKIEVAMGSPRYTSEKKVKKHKGLAVLKTLEVTIGIIRNKTFGSLRWRGERPRRQND